MDYFFLVFSYARYNDHRIHCRLDRVCKKKRSYHDVERRFYWPVISDYFAFIGGLKLDIGNAHSMLVCFVSADFGRSI